MNARKVHVTAKSRLHFGLMSFGRSDARQYGGVGVMVAKPSTKLTFSANDRLEATGPSSSRALEFAERVARALKIDGTLGCRIDILEAPRPHTGLGSGTQLGLSVARGMFELFGKSGADKFELARAAGRAGRSAVGTFGFDLGGLIFERGRFDGESRSELLARVAIPEDWRFVLICPSGQQGLSGEPERRAFAQLPPVPQETTFKLHYEASDHLMPAAARGDFDTFSRSLYRYGCLAGMCFAEHQGSAFASSELNNLVEEIRSLGVQGVGQSSWGPTLFAILPSQDAADDFACQLRKLLGREENNLEITITEADNSGVQIEVEQIETIQGA